jgi:uncharacterized protein
VSAALAGLAGALFGAGLLVAGMTQPARVVGFLDLTGRWDPSLAFVMAGAMAVYALAFRSILGRRDQPWFDVMFHLPSRREIDLPLLAGAAIFGVGWGLGGFCPGPGLVAAASGAGGALVFVGAMLAGMLAQHAIARRFA